MNTEDAKQLDLIKETYAASAGVDDARGLQ